MIGSEGYRYPQKGDRTDMQQKALTDIQCRKEKSGATAKKLFDGGGLFLEIRPNGSKLWRLKYRFSGKEKLLALGSYPDISLANAREARTDAKRLLHCQIDPGLKRKSDKLTQRQSAQNTLEAVAREWHTKYVPGWATSHSDKVLLRLEKNVFPWLGSRPISEIEAPELLESLRRMEKRGVLDTTRRVRQYLTSVYRFAIATGRAKYNPAADLVGAIPPPLRTSYASITDSKEIGKLLRAIDAYEGSLVTRTALALAPMLFCRPGELRGMEWGELDLDGATWRIPPARQKLKMTAKRSKSTGNHLVPLSTQADALLRDIQPLTGDGRFVFPSERTKDRSMSDGTVNAALRRMGYSKDEITGHGFRHMASTLLNEQGYSADAIEKQLSHQDANGIRDAYNRAQYMPERIKMMQAWADRLDRLKKTGAT